MSDNGALIKALRALTRDRGYPLDDLGLHFGLMKDIEVENDRLIAIICGGAVEEALLRLLESKMPNGSGRLFDINQPLGTFSAKIGVAYSFKFIDNVIERNSDYIRNIRNAFSHHIAPINFQVTTHPILRTADRREPFG